MFYLFQKKEVFNFYNFQFKKYKEMTEYISLVSLYDGYIEIHYTTLSFFVPMFIFPY